MSTPIRELRDFIDGSVAVRLLNALTRAGIDTIEEARKKPDDYYLSLPEVGKRTVDGLWTAIDRYDRAMRLDGVAYVFYRVMAQYVPVGRMEDFISEIEFAHDKKSKYIRGDPHGLHCGPNDTEKALIKLARDFTKRASVK